MMTVDLKQQQQQHQQHYQIKSKTDIRIGTQMQQIIYDNSFFLKES